MARKAVVLAAGKGARLAPITDCVPKELLPIAGFPALHHVLSEAAESGVTDVLIVLSRGKETIERYFAPNIAPKGERAERLSAARDRLLEKMRVSFAFQEKPLGTGDAILAAKRFAGCDPILVLYPDDVLGLQTRSVFRSFCKSSEAPLAALWKSAEERGRSAVLVREVLGRDARKYGVVYPADRAFDLVFRVREIREKPLDFSGIRANVLLGRMVLTHSLMNVLSSIPKRDDLGVIPALNEEAKNGRLDAFVYRGENFDLGSHESYLDAVVKSAVFLEE